MNLCLALKFVPGRETQEEEDDGAAAAAADAGRDLQQNGKRTVIGLQQQATGDTVVIKAKEKEARKAGLG